MKKKLILFGSIILSALLLFSGCRKEIEQPAEESAEQASARKGNSGKCRVTSFDYYDGIAGVHQVDYYTYKKGLVDQWAVSYGGVYKMEYDNHDKLKKSRYYDGKVLVYTIHFFYRNGKVFKEIWYNGNTKEVDDIIYYTYDRKGQLTRMESSLHDYYNINAYTADGDLASWKLYFGGSLFASGHYTYRDRYKSPFVEGTPGIDYNFPYSNSTFGYTKWWYSGERITYYDETGAASVYYDQDPRKTKWQIGNNNYPEHVKYVDRLSGTRLSVGFEFENCGKGNSGGHGHHRSGEMTSTRKASALTSSSLSIRSVLSGPRKELKQRVNELRRQLKTNSIHQ